MFNVREGFTADDDQLPARFFAPTKDGPLADKSLRSEEMEKARRYYYHLMGWDENGIPMPEKVEELGIDQ
jgi:aldehyde:ferredoxin oxidoreductase